MIKKAVFPVAGLGTRFLPATKANPKEMLPIVDKPLVQYAVEEAVAAGITELIFVTSSNKRAIEDHFDKDAELEQNLRETGRHKLLELVENILPNGVSCAYVRQPKQLGLGHAVACAAPLIGDETFAVLLADDLIETAGSGCLTKMVEQYQQQAGTIVGVQPVASEEIERYGVIALQENDFTLPLKNIVEKPSQQDAPSNFGVVGRYILTADIFAKLAMQAKGAGGEYQLTDAIAEQVAEQRVYAHLIKGKRYDCGNKLGYLKATVNYAMQHQELRHDFATFLKTFVEQNID